MCMQNGVENERIALRCFANVYGAVVMAPVAHLQPGIVQAYGTDLTGAIDVGCYPEGVDDRCTTVCATLHAAHLSSLPREDIMSFKYAKLPPTLRTSSWRSAVRRPPRQS